MLNWEFVILASTDTVYIKKIINLIINLDPIEKIDENNPPSFPLPHQENKNKVQLMYHFSKYVL